jgi:hypothetical protein
VSLISKSAVQRSAERRRPTPVRRIPRRRPSGAVGEAILRWGDPSAFQFISGGGTTQPIYDFLPGGDEEAEDDEALGLQFTETERQVTVVRVSNPEDAADFVDVERIDRISFLGPDGLIRTFILNNA